jgi:peptidyl-prolyl cis-trans isomerase SurA
MTRIGLRMSGILAFLAFAAAAGPTQLRAAQELGVQFGQPQAERQPPADTIELIDRVVAVVGDTALLLSELKENILQLEARGIELPAEGSPGRDSLMHELLFSLIDQAVLLNRAVAASVTVDAELIDRETDRRFREVRNSFPSAAEFQQTVVSAGLNLFQYRETLRNQVRAQFLIETFLRNNRDRLPPVSVSEEEILAYFEENATGQDRQASLWLEQLVIKPSPSEEAADSAIAIANQAIKEIRSGTDFEIVARRYSQDPGSRDDGGELGWLRRGDLVSRFAAAAWAAKPGQVIGPVETEFGYHVILVDRVRGAERSIRHVLVRPEVTELDVELARELASTLADSVRAGAEITLLAEHYGTTEELIRHDNVPLAEIGDRFQPAYAEALAANALAVVQAGGIIGPFEGESLRGDGPIFVIIKVIKYLPEGPFELADVRDQIRDGLMQEKQMDRFLEMMKSEVYVRVLY